MSIPATIALGELGVLTEIARGGIGTVSAMSADLGEIDGPLVAKLFHRPADVRHRALYRMVGWRRALPDAERRRLDRVAAWPIAVITKTGEPVGFVMRRVPPRFEDELRVPSGAYRTMLREAQYLLSGAGRVLRLGLHDAGPATRLEVLWDLAETLGFLHARGIFIGDLSARNVLWAADPGDVLLVDCDSMVLAGVGSPLEPLVTVDWDDPSATAEATAATDVYKFALFVLRTLGRSFQSRDPALADQKLDPYGSGLLRMSLDADPGRRPDAGAWERWAVGRRAALSARAATR